MCITLVGICGQEQSDQVCVYSSSPSFGQPQYADDLADRRADMKLRLEVRMSIIGLVTHPISETQISGVTCPFELPANSV